MFVQSLVLTNIDLLALSQLFSYAKESTCIALTFMLRSRELVPLRWSGFGFGLCSVQKLFCKTYIYRFPSLQINSSVFYKIKKTFDSSRASFVPKQMIISFAAPHLPAFSQNRENVAALTPKDLTLILCRWSGPDCQSWTENLSWAVSWGTSWTRPFSSRRSHLATSMWYNCAAFNMYCTR